MTVEQRTKIILGRITAEGNKYVLQNDLNGFLKAAWSALTKEFPELQEKLDLYSLPGFKTNEQRKIIEQFEPEKEALDKIFVIIFDAAILNTPEAIEQMTERLKELFIKITPNFIPTT